MPGEIRIIAGLWRGRKIVVPNMPALRPTTDQVRETLFNWLSNDIVGARCLDCYAGSGALGFESLSRGAREVVMLDHAKVVVEQLKKTAQALNTQAANIHQFTFLKDKMTFPPFDIVFVDPPFAEDLCVKTAAFLESQCLLMPNALIYLEHSTPLAATDLPANWTLLKTKKTGQVAYHLAQRQGP